MGTRYSLFSQCVGKARHSQTICSLLKPTTVIHSWIMANKTQNPTSLERMAEIPTPKIRLQSVCFSRVLFLSCFVSTMRTIKYEHKTSVKSHLSIFYTFVFIILGINLRIKNNRLKHMKNYLVKQNTKGLFQFVKHIYPLFISRATPTWFRLKFQTLSIIFGT